MKKEKPEKLYRTLSIGSKVKPLDEYQKPDGSWNVITKKMFKGSPIWKTMRLTEDSYPVRRPLN